MVRTKTHTNMQRSTTRYDFPATIEYRLDPPMDDNVYRAVIINISPKGLAAYLFNFHPEGQKLTILTPLPVDYSRATVRWMKKEDENLFMTGLHFIDSLNC